MGVIVASASPPTAGIVADQLAGDPVLAIEGFGILPAAEDFFGWYSSKLDRPRPRASEN